MENTTEGSRIISRLRRTTSVPVRKVDSLRFGSSWNYEIYREYLLAIGRGRESLLSIDQYPTKIDLSKPWHEVFDQIRVLADEGWVLIGYEEGQRRLILSRIAAEGLSRSVPHEVRAAALNRAQVKVGITDLVGDAHSHPTVSNESTVFGDEKAAFSLGADLYGFLDDLRQQRPSDPKRSVMFVVEGNENIAVFATRESLGLVRNNLPSSGEDFAKQWYGKYGWNFQSIDLVSGEIAKPGVNAVPVWKINRAIAADYQLAFYQGFKGGPLVRNYPGKGGF